MLNKIILKLNNGRRPNCDQRLISENKVPDGNSLVVTDNISYARKCEKSGIPVIYESRSDEFADGVSYVTDDIAQCDYDYLDMVYRRKRGLPLDILETGRCTLREMTTDDLPILYDLYDDDEVRKYIEPLYSYEEEKKYTEDYIKNMYGFYGFGLWLAFERKTGRLVGRAGISLREIDGESCHEIGYIIHRDFRRKGYASEICHGIIKYAFDELGINELYIVTEKSNKASVMTAEKLEFERISSDEKYYIYNRKNGHE